MFGGVYLSGSLAEIPRRHFQGCEIQIRDGDWLMSNIVGTRQPVQDQPLLDTTPYGSGVDDSVTDTTENAAITQHTATINGTAIAYTAMAGHLVTTDVYSARPVAKIFYVSFTANGAAAVHSSRYLFLQRRTWIFVGLSLAGIVRAATDKDQHARFHSARPLCTGGQSREPARSYRSGIHQSRRHRLFRGNCAGQER